MIGEYHHIAINVTGRKTPTFFYRFEDLRLRPQETLEAIFCFLLDLKSVEGTNVQHRIRQVVSMGHKATVTYA